MIDYTMCSRIIDTKKCDNDTINNISSIVEAEVKNLNREIKNIKRKAWISKARMGRR